MSANEFLEIITIVTVSQGRSPSGLSGNVPNLDIELSEFEQQSRYYNSFWTKSLGKGTSSLTPFFI